MLAAFEYATVLACTLFAGAALYVSLVEHPARMECGTELAATVFGPSYRRAAVMQATLALVATVGGVATWLMGSGMMWLIGAALIFAVIPFTFVVIMPTNKQLLDATIDRRAEATRILLHRWGRLHAMRTLLSLLASMIFLASVL
jgi:hypothetical protein